MKSKAVAKFLDKQQAIREQAEKLDDVAAEVEALGFDSRLYYSGTFPISVDIHMNVRSTTEVAEALRKLASISCTSAEKAGMTFEEHSDSAIAFRLWRLKRGVRLFCRYEGGTCRKVQVGTKEVPVYEIQCVE